MKRMMPFLTLFLMANQALAAGQLANVEIFDRKAGRKLPVYESDGQWFVAGRPGSEYRIEVRNRDHADLLAVVSVDGVNVVSGETAAVSQSGYVIERGRPLSISGWRKSLNKVAAFYFTDLGDSYAARTGRPDHAGVIGVALFRRRAEAPAELQEHDYRSGAGGASDSAARSAAPADRTSRAAGAAEAEKKIGTGHGRQQHAPARLVEFERDTDVPVEVIAIRYDTYENLLARGVIRSPRCAPTPFPGGFVPDPPHRGQEPVGLGCSIAKR